MYLNTSVSNNFRIASLNVRGMAQRKKLVSLKRLLTEECIDVHAVQKSKLSGDDRIERASPFYPITKTVSPTQSGQREAVFVVEKVFAFIGS